MVLAMPSTFRDPFSGSQRGKLTAPNTSQRETVELSNNGEFDAVVTQSSEDNGEVMRRTTFQHAEVGMPIFSISNVTKEAHEVTFR